MPIRPENKARYPAEWPEISRRVREEAGERCELCGAENGRPHPVTGSIVVLTVMHLDHQPENCARENLKAGCQRCHNRYDAKHRAQTRRATARAAVESAGQTSLLGLCGPDDVQTAINEAIVEKSTNAALSIVGLSLAPREHDETCRRDVIDDAGKVVFANATCRDVNKWLRSGAWRS